MSEADRVRRFLSLVRRRAILVAALRATGFTAAAVFGSLFLLSLGASAVGPAASWPAVTWSVLLCLVTAGVVLWLGLPAHRLRSTRGVARFAGERHPALASDLVSAVELDGLYPNGGSPTLTRAFQRTVADATEPLEVEVLVPLRAAARAGLAALAGLLLLLAGTMLWPSTVGRGLRLLTRHPSLFEGAVASREPLVGDVRITYIYPPYTGLPQRVVEGSTGDVIAPRGTQVRIQMRPLRSARKALLLLGEAGEAGQVPVSLDQGRLSASLLVNQDAVYRVWLEPLLGRAVREIRAHRIVAQPDQAPEVDIAAPADRLELPVPRPVEVGFQARDDFGLARLELVYRVNDGPEQRLPLKDPQGARSVRGTTLFEPSSAMLTPGARVSYRIEARDRDDVSGAKTGTSRTLQLVIHNPREHLEEKLAQQHEILDRLVGTLADRIELGDRGEPEQPPLERLWRWRELHETEESHLVLLGRLIDQLRRSATASKVLVSSLAGIADRLGKHMRDEADLLRKLRAKADMGALNPAWLGRLAPAGQQHVTELESAVLALDDLIGRQRLEDMAALGRELTDAHRRLQDLLSRYNSTGDENLRRQIEREIRELRSRIEELARKIAEVRARNEVGAEWMNMPDTRKAMEKAAHLDSLLEKGDTRSLSQALAELGEALQALQSSLDQNAGDFGQERFPQESRALADLMKKIGELEGDQRGLAQDSQTLAQESEAEAAKRLQGQLNDFQARAKENLEALQRKLAGAPPREAGSQAAGELERAREGARQVRRLLPEQEWAEARKEMERLVVALRRLQGSSAERASQAKPRSSSLDAFAQQMQDASGLAQGLAADLARLFPSGDEALSPEQRQRARGMADRQDSVAQRTEELGQEMGKRQGQVPGADMAGSELQGIAGQMKQAGRDLRQSAAKEGAGRARDAAERLAKLRDSLGQGSGGSSQNRREPVRIPGADEYHAPREWRQELLDAMREKAPEKFRDEVRRYYEELVR